MRHRWPAWLWIGVALASVGSAPAIAASPTPTLSMIEPLAHGCRWVRYDPVSRERHAIATLAHEASGAKVAWAPGSERALIWFEVPRGERPEIDAVNVSNGEVHALPAPPLGSDDELHRVSFDASGTPVALVLREPKIRHDRAGSYLRDNGWQYRIPAGQEGIPAIALAYGFTAGHWRARERAYTTGEWDYAQDVDALSIAKQLTPDSSQRLDYRPGKPVADAALLARLKAFAPKLDPEQGEWHQLTTLPRPTFVWEVSDEFLTATARVAVSVPGGLAPLKALDFAPTETVAYAVAAPYMLVTASDAGDRPRLFDLRGPGRLYVSNTAVAACFWP